MHTTTAIGQDDTLFPSNDGLPTPRPRLGQVVNGEQRIVRHLGTGGMGAVYLTRHMTLGTRAAIKLLRNRDSFDLARRFAAEAELLSQQDHPNIVRLFECGALGDGTPYISMEYAAGIDLGRLLELEGACAPQRVLRIVRQVACALDYLHGRGVLHRDIKPSNAIIDPDHDDALKLIDLGIAIREGCPDLENRLCGTPAYMAPEQAYGQRASRASDLYALGALTLELLTGQPPFAEPALKGLLRSLLQERPALPSARGLHIPGLDAFFERALSRSPAARFQTGAELVGALEPVLLRTRPKPARAARGWLFTGALSPELA